MADYCTTSDVKARINKTGAEDDAVLAAIITAASRSIDRFCNVPDGFTAGVAATARLFVGRGEDWLRLDSMAAAPTLVEVKDSVTDTLYVAWAATDWLAASGDPKTPDYNSLPYTLLITDPNGNYPVFTDGRLTERGLPTVRVTAKWAFSTATPPDIREACAMQTARWYKRYQSAMADTVSSPEMGQMLYRASLDPEIKHILIDGRYVRAAVG